MAAKEETAERVERAHRVRRDLEQKGLWGIVERVAKQHRVAPIEVIGRDRHRIIVRARHELWRELVAKGYTMFHLGQVLEVDHTSIMHAVGPVSGGANKMVHILEWFTRDAADWLRMAGHANLATRFEAGEWRQTPVGQGVKGDGIARDVVGAKVAESGHRLPGGEGGAPKRRGQAG